MTANEFRDELRQILLKNRDKVLLRIVVGPGFQSLVELTGREILEQAEALAERYMTTEPSGTVLLLLPHSPELFLLHFGLVLKGRLPAILAWPTSRIDAEKYQRNLAHQLRNLPAHQLITLPQLAENLRPSLPFLVTPCPISNAAYFEKNLAVPIALPPAGHLPSTSRGDILPDALFLQFSGGTTGAQKAVVVTAEMHVAQMKQLQKSLAFGEKDGVVSWLPMYHDMGLIACLWFPLWNGAHSLQFSATDWLLNPEMLFFYMERYRGTFCWLPNFAFSYLAGRRTEMPGQHSLEHVRGWINCSEPVRLTSMRSFHEAFHTWGVKESSLQACYAMAENVFAVTQTDQDRAPAVFSRALVRRSHSSQAELACQILDDVYVSSGRPVEGAEVRICNGEGVCGNGEPGEIQIRTPSLFSGYWGPDGFVTTSLSGDGWYSTGDFGFIAETELYVIGRMKDIVIVGGQNIFPEDVEAIVNTVSGIYPGRVVAFGVQDDKYGTESLVVVAELRGEFDKTLAAEVRKSIQKLVLSIIGIAPRYVVVVPERWIVKSTAGKISRRETKQRFLGEVLHGSVAVPVRRAESEAAEGTHA